MTKAVVYGRTCLSGQDLDSQFVQLRDIAAQRGFELTGVYSDFGNLSSKARRPGMSALLRDARRGKFSVILVSSLDRLATSTRNLIQMVQEFEALNIRIISAREAVDTGTTDGQMFVKAVHWITELERSIGSERIRAGLRRRRLEGLPIGRPVLDVDHDELVRDRIAGMSLTQVAKRYGVSRASVVRFVREAQRRHSCSAPLSGCHEFAEEVAA